MTEKGVQAGGPSVVLALTILAFSAACSRPAPMVCRADGLGEPVARATSEAIERAPRLRVGELWRAGGLDDGAALTNPTAAQAGPDGTLAIPDFGAATVWLLGADGAWLAPAGVAGEGPGEFSRPLAAAWTDDGELLILDAGARTVTRFDREMRLVRTESVPTDLIAPVFAAGQIGWFGLRVDGVAFLEHPPTRVEGGEEEIVFAAAGPEDRSATAVWRGRYPVGVVPGLDRIRRPEWPRTLMAVGSRYWVVAPESDRYELSVFGPDEELRLHVCVDSDPVPATRSGEVRAVPEPVRAVLDTLRAAERTALFSRLVIDRDGRLWVERDLPGAGAPFDRMYGVPGATLDVISREGRVLGRVRMPDRLRFQDALGDTIWGFEVGELDEVSVVAGELVPVR